MNMFCNGLFEVILNEEVLEYFNIGRNGPIVNYKIFIKYKPHTILFSKLTCSDKAFLLQGVYLFCNFPDQVILNVLRKRRQLRTSGVHRCVCGCVHEFPPWELHHGDSDHTLLSHFKPSEDCSSDFYFFFFNFLCKLELRYSKAVLACLFHPQTACFYLVTTPKPFLSL